MHMYIHVTCVTEGTGIVIIPRPHIACGRDTVVFVLV